MSHICCKCNTIFSKKSNLTRHINNICVKNCQIEIIQSESKTEDKETKTEIKTHKLVVKLKTKTEIQSPKKLISNDKLRQISVLVPENPLLIPNSNDSQVVTILKEIHKETQQKFRENQQKLEEMQRKIDELEGKTIINNSNTLIQNIICFDHKTIDLYVKKREKLGSEQAFLWLSSLLKNANKDNKFNWVTDPDIIDKSIDKYPFELKPSSGKKLAIGVRVKPTEMITDDGTQINKIGNDIVSNSVITAIQEATDRVFIDDLYVSLDENKLATYFQTPIYEKIGKTIYDDLSKYKKIVPNKSHLKELAEQKLEPI